MVNRIDVLQWKAYLTLNILLLLLLIMPCMISGSAIPKQKPNTRQFANRTDGNKMEIVCILDHDVYCQEHQVGFIFDDGCRDCICKNDGAYCRSRKCVNYQDTTTNPEEYCSKIVEQNENNMTRHRDIKNEPSEYLPNSYEHKPENKTDGGSKDEELKPEKSQKVVGTSFMSFGEFGPALNMMPKDFDTAMQEKDTMERKQESSSDEALSDEGMRNESESMESIPPSSPEDRKRVPSPSPYPDDGIPTSILDLRQDQTKKQGDENEPSEVDDGAYENDEPESYLPPHAGGNYPRNNEPENNNSNRTSLFDDDGSIDEENELIPKNMKIKATSDTSFDYDSHDDSPYDETLIDMSRRGASSPNTPIGGDIDTSMENFNNTQGSGLFVDDIQQTNDDGSQTSDEEKLVRNVQPVMSELNNAIDTENVESVVEAAEGIVDGKLSSVVMGDRNGKNERVDNNPKTNNADNHGENEDSKQKRSTDQNFLSNKNDQTVSTTPAPSTKNGEDLSPTKQTSKTPVNSKNGESTSKGNSSKESGSNDWVSREITVQSRTVKLPDKNAMEHMHEIFPGSGGAPVLEVEERDTHSFQDSLHGEHEKVGGVIQPVSFTSDGHEGDVLFKLDELLRQLAVLTRCVEGLKMKFASCQKQQPQPPQKHPKPPPPKHLGPKSRHNGNPVERSILSY